MDRDPAADRATLCGDVSGMSAALRLEREGAIAALVIDRPQMKNAFNQEMWERLPTLLAEAVADPQIRVIMLRSAAPGAFSSGADIAELAGGAADPAWVERNRQAIRHAQRELARAAKPTLALIEGACVGGGCGLAMACDLRIATPGAKLGIPAAKLGLIYSLHDTKLLVDLIGPSRAKRLLFTGELIGAAEAERIGLVDRVAEDAAREALLLAQAIAAVSPDSVRGIKAIIRRILDGQADDDESTRRQFDAAFESKDFRDGIAAFLEKQTSGKT
jgi:enoyl-CoA hydratase/carnithine racemase